MRALLLALILLIVAVTGGTVALLLMKPRTSIQPPTAEPTRKAKPAGKAVDDKPKGDGPRDPYADAEPLPDVPKVTEKSQLKALNEDKTLYLEVPEKGPKRVLFAAEVCMREGILEVLVCKKQTKEHESILRTEIDARFLHAALLAAGAKNGKPVQFVNPKTDEPDYQPASGSTIRVSVHYTKGGKTFTHPAQEWILDKNKSQTMAYDWVFAGSRFQKNPDRPNDPEYYCANNGEVIAISNFSDSMLDIPVRISDASDELHFETVTRKIPPLGSKVWVIMESVPEKK
jgi:hypothetical protein